MKYSIKMVDRSRFDYVTKGNEQIDLKEMIRFGFIGFPIDGGAKYFNSRNIVSITETEADE